MAKNKTGKRDTDDMTKSEIRAYHKEINEYFTENGWRSTLAHFSLSPKQASAITEKTRARMEKEAEKEKEAKKKAKAAKKAEKAPKKKAPKKAAKKTAKAEKAEKAPAKKRGRPKKANKIQVSVDSGASANEITLDYLLAYRGKKGSQVSLDMIIADLATEVRA